jgi:hypothetical protein
VPKVPTVDNPQNLRSHVGKMLRLNDDGRVPADHSFIGNDPWLPEIRPCR